MGAKSPASVTACASGPVLSLQACRHRHIVCSLRLPPCMKAMDELSRGSSEQLPVVTVGEAL